MSVGWRLQTLVVWSVLRTAPCQPVGTTPQRTLTRLFSTAALWSLQQQSLKGILEPNCCVVLIVELLISKEQQPEHFFFFFFFFFFFSKLIYVQGHVS